MSHKNFERLMKNSSGIPEALWRSSASPSAAIRTGLLAFSWGHVGTDFVEIFVKVKDGPTIVGVARTLESGALDFQTEQALLGDKSSYGWQVTANWKISQKTLQQMPEPTGMFKAVKPEDFFLGKASVWWKNGYVLLTREVQPMVKLCSPEEDSADGRDLVWVPPSEGETEWTGWPYRMGIVNYCLPLDTPPDYVAASPQGWTVELAAKQPVNVNAYTALMTEVSKALCANAAASPEIYEATLSELHNMISGFYSAPAKLRRQWHQEVTTAFSEERQKKLGIPVILGFFNPNLGVEESLFNRFPETVSNRFERADGAELDYLIIGKGPADMSVPIRAKPDFDLGTAQDFGWEDDFGPHEEYWDPKEGYVRCSQSRRTCYTLAIDPNTREVTVEPWR